MTVRFPLCFLGSPALVGKPVDRNNQSCTVSPVVAVDENRLIFGCVDDCECALYLLVRGPADPPNRDAEVVETQGSRVLFFRTGVFVGSPQVDDGFYTKLSEPH